MGKNKDAFNIYVIDKEASKALWYQSATMRNPATIDQPVSKIPCTKYGQLNIGSKGHANSFVMLIRSR